MFPALRCSAVMLAFWCLSLAATGAEPSGPAAKQFRAGAWPSTSRPTGSRSSSTAASSPSTPRRPTIRCTRGAWCWTTAQTRIAIVVVDNCVLDRAICDEAKQLAEQRTGIPAGRMFISATHCHSAPAAVGALGTDPDERYRKFLPGKIAEGIQAAQQNLAPAQVGWAVGRLPGVPQSRRWIARPDTIKEDPFGEKTTRATMHPGYRNPDWEEPSGPMNPDVPGAGRAPAGRAADRAVVELLDSLRGRRGAVGRLLRRVRPADRRVDRGRRARRRLSACCPTASAATRTCATTAARSPRSST